MAVIYCFGDSITYGAWDVERGGWSMRLRNYLDELQEKNPLLYFQTFNLGIPGENTDELVERFTAEISARENKDEENIIIIAFGANDSVFMKDTRDFMVPKDRFISNLQGILRDAQKISKKIILINITPADESVCAKRYGDKGNKIRLNKNVQQYNRLLASLAKNNGIPLVDIYSQYTVKDFRSFLSEDGLHPNEKGHQLIFEAVKTALQVWIS